MSSRLVRGAFGSTASSIVLAMLGLLTTPYVLHRLGDAAYGLVSLLSLASAHLSNLEFGFGHATVRFLARARASEDLRQQGVVVESSFAVFLAGGLVGAILLLAGSRILVETVFHVPLPLQPAAIACFRLTAVSLLASFLSSFFLAVLQGVGHFSWMNGSRLLLGGLSSLGTVLVLYLGGGVVAVVAMQCVVASVGCIFLGALCALARGAVAKPRPSRRALVDMGSFAAYTFAAGVAYQLMLNGPPLVLAAHVPSSLLPAFSIPQAFFQKITMLVGSVSVVFLPFVSAASVDKDFGRLREVFRSHMRLTLLGLGAVSSVLCVFAEPLLAVWIDPEYAARGAPCLRWFAVAALVLGLGAPAADVARGLGRPQWVLTYTGAVAAAGTLLALSLVSPYQGAGVAAAFSLALAAGTALLILAVARGLLGESAGGLLRIVVGPASALSILCAVFVALLGSVGNAFLLALAATIALGVYCFAVASLVLAPQERSALWGAVGMRASRPENAR